MGPFQRAIIVMGAAASSDDKYVADALDEDADDGGGAYDLSGEAAATFLKTIAPVLAHCPEADREALAEACWRAAGHVWHDRDDEVAALEDEVRELRTRSVAAPNRFPLSGTVPPAAATPPRIVAVSSRVPDRGDLVAAVRDPAWVLEYDFETATAESLAAALEAKAGALGGSVATVALCNHGPDADGWAVASALRAAPGVPLEHTPLAALVRAVGALPGLRRVDLLACDLAATPGGLDLVADLEALAGVDVAASVDVTGNLAHGGDWVLETDDVDAAAAYFDRDKLDAWDGILRAGLRNGTSKFLRRRRERARRKRRGQRVRVDRGKPTGRFHHPNHDPPACAVQ